MDNVCDEKRAQQPKKYHIIENMSATDKLFQNKAIYGQCWEDKLHI